MLNGRTLVHAAAVRLLSADVCAEFCSLCASSQHQARRPSERDFHRSRLEAYRANYEALLAELRGGVSSTDTHVAQLASDTQTRHEANGAHDSNTHKRRR